MARSMYVMASLLGFAACAQPLTGQSERVQRVTIAEGDTVVVTTIGDGPAVVIVTGLLGGAYSFRQVTPALLEAGMRVVVVEPLGMGSSARPRTANYTLEAQATRVSYALNAANVSEGILLCHAVGGAICYRVALQSPARVRGIVAVNSGPDESAASPGLRRAMRFAPIMRLLGGAGRARASIQDGLIENSHDPAWVTEEVLEQYTAPYRDFGSVLDALTAMASAREPEPLAPRLVEIQAPVRLLVGTSGKAGLTRPEEVDILRAIPDFRVTEIARAGQYIQEERPGAVVEAVLSLHRNALAARGSR